MPAGRPTLYDEKMNQQVYKLALLGAKDSQIADYLEIAESTLNLWKQEHPKFMESLKRGKLKADSKVAASLYKRANGFSYEEVTHENTMITKITDSGEMTQEPGTLVKRVKKLVIPDTTAQIFWLKNRQPSEWRDKQEIESTNYNHNVTPTPEEAKAIKEAIEKQI